MHKAISPESVVKLTSQYGQPLLFQRGKGDQYFVDIHSDILEDHIIAKNGVIYLLDQVLECDCKIKES